MSDHVTRKQTYLDVDFSATNELFSNERCLKNYNTDIVKKITKGFLSSYIALHKKINSFAEILEFGAGIGSLAVEYALQSGIKPDCIEIDPKQTKIINERGFKCFSTIGELQKKYDAIYSSNVLEHIEDDAKVIKEFYESLKPGGCIAIYVPAHMCLWSQMDESVGHYRRYSKKELLEKVYSSGFKILSCHYVDSIGFFASFYFILKGYKAGNNTSLDKGLKIFDTFLYPLSRILDWLGCRYLFGKNLLLIAEKSAN